MLITVYSLNSFTLSLKIPTFAKDKESLHLILNERKATVEIHTRDQ